MNEEERTEEVVWPEPQEDPDEERSHWAARIVDRDRNRVRGDVLDDDAREKASWR